MLEKHSDTEIVWQAAEDTVIEAGPLPENIEDASEHEHHWYTLMRREDPRLNKLTDPEIHQILVRYD